MDSTIIRRIALSLVLATLLPWAAVQAARIVANVGDPVELDYGEGIILWQASQVFNLKSAFHPIQQYPHVVFHYTPLYHVVVNLVTRVLGDPLVSGRLVSLVCTAWLIALLAWTVRRVTRGYATNGLRWFGAVFTGAWALLVPSMQWVPWARVDMLGLALQFTALSLLIVKRFRVGSQVVAMALLLLGLYTKQSLLSVPTACILLIAAIRLSRAVWLAACLGAAGLSVFLVLAWATNGMVLRHWILYNVNPFHWKQALTLQAEFSRNLAGLIAVGLAGFWVCIPRAGRSGWRNWKNGLSARLQASPLRRAAVGFGLVATCGFVVSWGVGKEGANINYCLDWQLALCPLAGIFVVLVVRGWSRRERSLVPLRPLLFLLLGAAALLIGVPTLVDSANAAGWSGTAREKRLNEREDQAKLVQLISSFPGPVVSENMTLLLKAGKTIPFEPAIVKVDTEAGIFDEAPLVKRTSSKFFDAFILYTGTGRFTPNMWRAIRENYRSYVFGSGTYTVYVRN